MATKKEAPKLTDEAIQAIMLPLAVIWDGLQAEGAKAFRHIWDIAKKSGDVLLDMKAKTGLTFGQIFDLVRKLTGKDTSTRTFNTQLKVARNWNFVADQLGE